MTTPGGWSVSHVFDARPKPLQLFREVERYIRSLGEVTMKVTKSQVSFGVKRQFAWVWLPGRWTGNRPENSIVLSFGLNHRADHPRIVESTEPRPGRWTHHVILLKKTDFSREVRQWLTEAYEQAKA